jgi:hypothetical protein
MFLLFVHHSTGTCAAQLKCLRKVCGHVTVSDHRLSKPEGFNVSLYVVVNIANEDKKLQTLADIIPFYARKIKNISVERKYPFFTLKLDFDVA